MFFLRPAFKAAKARRPTSDLKSTPTLAINLENHEDSIEKGPVVVGHDENFWLFDEMNGWDLTHRSSSPRRIVQPVTLKTTSAPVTIDPYNSVLVIIDMQNLFLSTELGNKEGDAHKAEAKLLQTGIPAARKAGIQIMYLNWGITENDIHDLPPTMVRAFNFSNMNLNHLTDAFDVGRGKEKRATVGIGEPLGDVTLPDGSIVDAGRRLIRDEWNTELHEPLKADYDTIRAISNTKPLDIRTHRSRLSAFWSDFDSPCLENLQEKGIRTLLFAGINNDQCVITNIQDAVRQGFDAILLEDACATTNSDDTWETVGFEGRKPWGFVSSCDALAEGVDAAGFESD